MFATKEQVHAYLDYLTVDVEDISYKNWLIPAMVSHVKYEFKRRHLMMSGPEIDMHTRAWLNAKLPVE